ncbi:transposable element Tcb1 transposase [Trichonephila clavipes]|nr:transposable element Tcb1 transposase [Trichonephila clavipes]
MHHSVSTHIIPCRSQHSGMSTRDPLLCLHLTGNHRCLRRQWCDERWAWTMEWNDIVFTHKSYFFLHCCVLHRHTGTAPGIMVW